jgi:hypothetical protein
MLERTQSTLQVKLETRSRVLPSIAMKGLYQTKMRIEAGIRTRRFISLSALERMARIGGAISR